MDAKEKKIKKHFSLKAILEGRTAPCKPAVYTDLLQTIAPSWENCMLFGQNTQHEGDFS